MSPKELLYIEDALGHEQQMKKVMHQFCEPAAGYGIKNFVQELCNKHQQSFNRFYGLLNNN